MEAGIPDLLAAALRPASTRLTSTISPTTGEETQPGAVGAGAYPGTPGPATRPPPETKQTPDQKPDNRTISNRTSGALND